MEHVIDDYGWHITGSGEKSVSIPLPVILFDNGKPVVFMSSKFHHGHNAYKGYAIGFTPETKRTIVKLSENYTGEITELAEEKGIANEEQMAQLIDADASIIDISITKNVCSLIISITIPRSWGCASSAVPNQWCAHAPRFQHPQRWCGRARTTA